MRYFDAHTHFNEYYIKEADLDKYEEDLRANGIDRVFLISSIKQGSSNDDVLKAAEKKPDLIVPAAWIKLGADAPGAVDEAAKKGFAGLKFIAPPKRYDERDYFSYYERAEKHGLPCLFHSGILGREKDSPAVTSFDYMTPGCLETISRAFPGLTMIMAHLANPQYEVAAEIIRWNSNIYFAITGSTLGKLEGRLSYLKQVLWWDGAFDRLLFGTDMPPKYAPGVIRRHEAD